MQRLLRWIEWPIHIFMWVALGAGTLMMLHVSADVTGRAFFGRPIDGSTEIVSAYYMVLVAYLPWAYLAQDNRHLSVDVFTRLLPPKASFWLDIAVKIFVVGYLTLFVWQTGSQAIGQTRMGEVWQAGTTFIPVWPSRWVPAVAGGLMLLYLALKIVDEILTGPRPTESRSEPA